MIFTALFLPKKISNGLHNTARFRNHNDFEKCEFRTDTLSTDLLNGRCTKVKSKDWENALLSVSNKHAPIKHLAIKCDIKFLGDNWLR